MLHYTFSKLYIYKQGESPFTLSEKQIFLVLNKSVLINFCETFAFKTITKNEKNTPKVGQF